MEGIVQGILTVDHSASKTIFPGIGVPIIWMGARETV